MTPARTLPALLTLLAACGGGMSSSGSRASGPIEPAVRDSAGVTIYELPADALARAPEITIDTQAVTVIGGAAVEDDVTHLRALTLLPDARVAGFDGDLGAVRIYDASGRSVGTFGRKGEGPGEFRSVERLVLLPGDSLLAMDPFRQRATVIAPDSGIIRMETVPSRGYRQSFVVGGTLENGDWLFLPAAVRLLYRSVTTEPDTSHHPLPMGSYRPGSGADHLDTLVVAWEPPYHLFQARNQGKEDRVEGPGRYALYPITAAWDGQAAVLPNDCWCIFRYDGTRALRSVIRMPFTRFTITNGVKDSVIAAQMDTYRKQLAEHPERARFESIDDAEFNANHSPWAEELPVFADAMQSMGRLLWLRDAGLDFTDSLRLSAVAPDGRLVGRLIAPPRPRVVAIGDDRVILQTEDADGIVRYEIHKLRMPE